MAMHRPNDQANACSGNARNRRCWGIECKWRKKSCPLEASSQPLPSSKLGSRTRLFLAGLLGGLGDLATRLLALGDGLDDTDGDGLSHVTDGETAERRVLSEWLNAHRLGRNHLDDGSVTRLDVLGGGFNGLARATVDLLEELAELAGNVGSVAVQDWSVTSTDLARVVQDDDLGVEAVAALRQVRLAVTSNVTTTDLLDGNVLDVVAWQTLRELLVVHLDGLHFSGDTSRSEGNDHAGLDGTGLDTADWDSPNTTDLVDILEGKTERLVGRTARRVDVVNGLEEGLAGDLGLGLLLPALVPRAVGGGLDHVVTVETGDRHERDVLRVETDLLDEGRGLLDDLAVTLLGPLGGVHLVDGDDELLDTKGVGEQGVLTGLAILGDTSRELTSTSGNDEDGAVGLRGTSDHVLDEVTVTRGVNDGDIVLRSLELPQSNVDRDTTLTLRLQLVGHPGVLEGTLAELSGFLLELLDGTLVNTTAFVDEVASRGRLAGVDVTNDDDVDMSLLLTHGCGFDWCSH